MDYSLLIEKARAVMQNAYAPYSQFKVGAALFASSGNIYTGCNIENVSFGATVCAERVAVFSAIAQGERKFETIVLVNSSPNIVLPCGICRQVLAEFSKNLRVVAVNEKEIKEYTLKDLLPHAFDSF